MDEPIDQLRAAFASHDNAGMIEQLLKMPVYRQLVADKLLDVAKIYKGRPLLEWAKESAERIISFSNRQVMHNPPDEGYVLKHGVVEAFTLGYEDVEPFVFLVSDALIHAGRGIVAHDDTLLWAGATWATPPDFPGRAYGAIVSNPSQAEVLCLRPAEPDLTIPEAIWIAFGSKFFGVSIFSLASLALICDMIGSARIPLVTSFKFLPGAFEREAFDRMGLGSSEIMDLPEAPSTLVKRLWLSYVPIRLSGTPKSCSIAMDALRRRLGVASEAGVGEGEIVYMSRADASRRRVTNEDKIVAALQRFGCKTVTFSEMSIAERIDILKNAKIVLGPVGSNLSNVLFAPGSAWVIEFMPTFYDVDPAVREQIVHMVASMGHRYIRIPCEVEQAEGQKYTQWDLTVSESDVVAAVEFALSQI